MSPSCAAAAAASALEQSNSYFLFASNASLRQGEVHFDPGFHFRWLDDAHAHRRRIQ